MLRFLASALILVTPAIAWGQDAAPADWSVIRSSETDTVAATIDFTNGIGIMARCQAGVYDLIIQGVPAAASGKLTRELAIQVDDGESRPTAWGVGSRPDTAFSRIPAMVARDLAAGGKVQIVVPPQQEGGRRTRYVMDIAPSSTAIEQTLTACGRPLIDPRRTQSNETWGNGQGGLPAMAEWRIMPRPVYPPSVRGVRAREGYVVLSCAVTEDGSLRECQTESEHPVGFKFGQEAQRSLPRARIQLTDDGAASGRSLGGSVIVFSINFRLDP